MSGRRSLPARTRGWFWCLMVLVSLQAGWWVLFHLRFGQREAARQEAAWRAQIEPARRALGAACALAAAAGTAPPDLERRLAADFPGLAWVPTPAGGEGVPGCAPGHTVAVDPAGPRALARRTQQHVRMFAFEGAFFVAALWAGGRAVYRALREELGLLRQQANFLSAVTHELKTPLASLRLFAETLALREVGAETRAHYLGTMVHQVERLEGQVANLLAAARLDAGSRAPATAPTELNQAAAGWVAEAQAALGAEQLPVAFCPAEAAAWADLDAAAIGCALRNLLDNARKYGQLRQRPCQVRVLAGRREVGIEVQDWGLGLAAEELGRVFDKFYRVGDEMVRRSEGSGLGLFLVQALAEASGGRADASSPGPHQGATFRLRFPRVAAPPTLARAAGG